MCCWKDIFEAAEPPCFKVERSEQVFYYDLVALLMYNTFPQQNQRFVMKFDMGCFTWVYIRIYIIYKIMCIVQPEAYFRPWGSMNLSYSKIATQNVTETRQSHTPDNKVQGANMGPTWGWQDQGGFPCGPREPCYLGLFRRNYTEFPLSAVYTRIELRTI